MKPRLPSSKKSTSFPQEYLEQIESVFMDNFHTQLNDSQLIIEGRIYTAEITLRVGVLEKGRLLQANFEVSMNYSQTEQDAVERIHDCIDAAASMMSEYFEKESNVDFPRTWKEYEFNQRAVFLQFSTVNTNLESQADALLGQSFEDMVQEDALSEDALDQETEKKEDEDSDNDIFEDEDGEEIDDEEIDDTTKPTIFGGSPKNKKLH